MHLVIGLPRAINRLFGELLFYSTIGNSIENKSVLRIPTLSMLSIKIFNLNTVLLNYQCGCVHVKQLRAQVPVLKKAVLDEQANEEQLKVCLNIFT